MAPLVKVTVEYSQPGASVPNNVFFFENATENGYAAIDEAVAEWVEDEWAAAWKEISTSTCELVSYVASEVDVTGVVLGFIGSALIGTSGLGAADVAAAAVSAVIHAATDRPKSRGRKFIPGLDSDLIDSGLFDASLLGDLAVLLVKYFSGFESSGGVELNPGVLSTVAGAFLEFNGSGGFDDIPDYQTRRRPDRGS